MPSNAQEIAHKLKALGLTEYEARAYIFLLSRGKSTAREVSQKSDVPYGRVYGILEDLKRKGLARKISGNVDLWTSTGASVLNALTRQKVAEIESVAREIGKLSKEKGEVVVVEDRNTFFRLLGERRPIIKEPALVATTENKIFLGSTKTDTYLVIEEPSIVKAFKKLVGK